MDLSSPSKLDGVAYLIVAAGVKVEAYALGYKGVVVLAHPGVVVVHVPLGGVIIIPVLFIESVIDGSVVFCIGVLVFLFRVGVFIFFLIELLVVEC